MITNLDGEEVGTRKEPNESIPPRAVMVTFAVLFAMNLLDYLDRNILTAVLPQLKADKIVANNVQAGALFTYFLISYSLVSPLMGWLGDRWRRTWLLGMGVGLWSMATVGTAFARDYQHLVLARALLGVGEDGPCPGADGPAPGERSLHGRVLPGRPTTLRQADEVVQGPATRPG